MQSVDFKGHFVLVEGVKDLRLYSKFFDRERTRLIQTFGKYLQRQVFAILNQRGFNEKLGVRDADFLRIPGNGKYDPQYSDDVFVTDHHDSEVMIFNSDALYAFLDVVSAREKVDDFQRSRGCSIRDLVYNLCLPIACLRYASKRYGLGLLFKPENPEGNRIKFKKFICDRRLVFLGVDDLIRTVCDYSRARSPGMASQVDILAAYNSVQGQGYSLLELVNGHDVAEVLFMVLKKGLNSTSELLSGPDSVESALSLSFDFVEFSKTQLYQSLLGWDGRVGADVLRRE